MISGILVLIIGLAFIVYAHKLEFDRTNDKGVQVFKDFTSKTMAATEGVMLKTVGGIFSIGGFLLTIAAFIK